MNKNYTIKQIDQASLEQSGAMELAWRVFSEFVAPEYSEEGIQEFKNVTSAHVIKQKMSANELFVWGCLDNDQIVGVIASRPPSHIALLFVDRNYHRQGIAHALYDTVLGYYKSHSDCHEMTVNSSPYAVEAYRRLGFKETDAEQTHNGIRYIPMKHVFR